MSASHFGFFGRIAEIDLTTGRRPRPAARPRTRSPTTSAAAAWPPACSTTPSTRSAIRSARTTSSSSPPRRSSAPTRPTAGRGHMVFKSPLTGVIGTSNSGGTWGAAFKAAGYDALVVKGRGRVAGLDRHHARQGRDPARPPSLGQDIHADERRADRRIPRPGDRPRVLCIGPAGENLVRFAAVANDKNRVYGRCGAGRRLGQQEPQGHPRPGPGKDPDRTTRNDTSPATTRPSISCTRRR